MNLKFRLKRFFQNLRMKETETDRKLQENTTTNRTITVDTRNENTDVNSCIVYINNYISLTNLFHDNKTRKIIERDFSEIKILVDSTINKTFLDSLNLFSKINHEHVTRDYKRCSYVQTEFLSSSYLVSPSNYEDKIYVLISGSIGKFCNFLDYYFCNYANMKSVIIGKIISNIQQISMKYDHFSDINKKYNLNLHGQEYNAIYPPKNEVLSELLESKRELDKEPRGKILEICSIKDIYKANKFDKEYDYILHQFEKLYTFTEEIIFINNQNNSVLFRTNMIKLSRMKRDIEEGYFAETLINHGANPYQFILQMYDELKDMISENSFTYYKNDEDEMDEDNSSSQTKSMYDLIDEIIQE